MTKNRSWMGKVRKVLLGVGVALAVGLVPSTAQAVTGGSASELESVGNLEGNQVYFGNYTGGTADGDLKWHVVDTESPDADGKDAITLWTGKTHIGNRRYNNLDNNMAWAGSEICHWLNSTNSFEDTGFLNNAFSTAEIDAIAPYKAGSERTPQAGSWISDLKQKIVLPAVSELANDDGNPKPPPVWGIYSTNLNFNDGLNYWLRSPGDLVISAASVDISGYVNPSGDYVLDNYLVVRPALKIPLDSILFTSSATSGSGAAKSEVVVGNGLQAVDSVAEGARTTTPLKLTVIDKDNQKLTVSKLSTLGNSVTVDYTDATTGTNQSLSVILEDADGKVAYYGKLAALAAGTDATGSASFSVKDLTAGTYTLKVFNEELNADTKTDVASEPAEYALNITDQGMAQLPDEGVLTGEVIAFDGYEWYVIGGDSSSALRVLLKSVADKNEEPNDLAYVGRTAFDSSSPYSYHYDGSDLKLAMEDSFRTIENEREKEIIQGRNLEPNGYNSSPPYSTGIAGSQVNNAKFWPLSTAEAVAIGASTSGDGSPIAQYAVDSVDGNAWGYWLRSPGSSGLNAAYVRSIGFVDSGGVDVDHNNLVVRPAFDIPLDSLLFTSSASGTSGDGWQEVEDLKPTTGDTSKFTMIDPNIEDRLALDVTSGDEMFAASDDLKVTIGYTNATLASGVAGKAGYQGNYFSALLTDKDGKRQYLRGDKLTAATGSADITLPENLAVGEYTLQVFNEEVNGKLYTNFTSPPVEVKVTVKKRAKVSNVTPNAESGKVSVEDGKELAITFDQAMNTAAGNEGTVKLKYGQDNSEELTATFKEWQANSDDKVAVYKVDGLKYGIEYTYELSGFKDADDVVIDEEKTRFAFKTIEKEVSEVKIASYTNATLNNFADGFEYTINGASVTPSSGVLNSNPDWIGTTIKVVKKGLNGDTSGDSEEQEIQLKQAPTPNITANPATTGKNDGKIFGVDDTMEYRTTNDGVWQDCPNGTIDGLQKDDTYYIRKKSKDDPDGYFYSKPVEIVITESRLPTTLHEVVAFDGYEWYVIGNGQSGVYPNEGRLTLLLKSDKGKAGSGRVELLPYPLTEGFGSTNKYANSNLEKALDKAYVDIENDREEDIIQPRDLEDGPDRYSSGDYLDTIAGAPVDNANYWAVSPYETSQLPVSVLEYSGDYQSGRRSWGWWLRSPGNYDILAAYVDSDGYVYPSGINVIDDALVVRPAFDLPLNSLLFTSSAINESGKIKGEAEGLSSTWKSKADLLPVLPAGAIPKYTMKSENIQLKVTDAEKTFYVDKDNREITINYKGATYGKDSSRDSHAGNYLSALLTLNGEEHYIKAEAITAAEGSATFKLPDGISDGEYTLKVFNEEINENAEKDNYKYTDFASVPVEITAQVGESATVASVTPVTADPDNTLYPINTKELRITFNQAMDITNKAGTVTLTDGTSPITATFDKWDTDDKTAVYKLSEDLEHSKTYAYTINGFKTANGMPMKKADTQFKFKTYSQEAKPAIGIDYTNERLTGFDSDNYILSSGSITEEDGVFYLSLTEAMLNGQKIDIVKKGTTGQSHDSIKQELTIPERPNAPDKTDFTLTPEVPSTDTKGTITGIEDGMQYRVKAKDAANFGEWTDGTGADLGDLEAGDTVEVRHKAVDGDNGKFASKPAVLIMNYQEAQPNYIAINYEANNGLGSLKEMIDGAAYEFVVGDDTTWATLANNTAIDDSWYGKKLSIVRKGIAGTSVGSKAYKLEIPERKGAPENIKMTPASAADATDGELKGVTDAMEYRVGNGSWITCPNGTLDGRKPGEVIQVRYRASNAHSQFIGTATSDFTMTARPVVESVSPTEDLPKSGSLTIEFTKDLKAAGTITLVNKDNAEDKIVMTDITIDGKKVTANYRGLTPGVTYGVVFDNEFKDTDGNALNGEAEANKQFEVTAAEALTVADTAPTNGAANVAIGLNEIKVTFSEAVDPEIDGKVILEGSGGKVTLSEPTWNATNTEATYKVESTLDYSTEYTYKISGFTSAKGFAMAEDNSRKFTTIAQAVTPNVAIDYDDEVLTNFEAGATYKIKIGEAPGFDHSGTEFALTESHFGKTISIIKKGDGSTSVDSEPQVFKIPTRNAAPEVTVEPESRKDARDGQMTVVSPAKNVQFKRESGDWEDYSVPIAGLTDGDKIDFRTKPTADRPGEFASGNFRSIIADRTMVSRPSLKINTPMTDAPVSGSFVLEFDQDMDTDVLGTVTLEGIGSGQPLAGVWTNNRTYTVSYSNLSPGQVYELTINGFKAELPTTLTMAEDTRWTLTIAGKPTVTAVAPSGTTNVPIDTTEVTIEFSDTMEETLGTVILTDEDNNTITATSGKWTDGPTNQIAVYEIAGLKHGKTYTYTISDFVSKKGTKLDTNKSYSFTTIGKEEAPVLTIDYVNEQLNGFDKDAKYQIVGEEGVLEDIESLDISSRITDSPTELNIVKLGTDGEKVDSEPASISLPARLAAPSGLGVKPASSDIADDGEITGVNDTMEYSLDNGATWTKVPKEGITKLAKGAEVFVRTAATNTSFHGKEVKLTMTDRPVVTSVTTSDSAPRDGQIEITFNKPMNAAPGEVMLGDIVLDAGKWNDNGTIYTVDYAGLKDSVTYQITISGFTDEVDGNEMAVNTEFTMTVGYHDAPTVESVTPTKNNVSITTNKLVVTFNEAVKAGVGKVVADGLTIENPVVNGTTVTYDLSGLERNKTYNVKVSGFTDIAGNEMVGEHLHEFSTERSTYKVAFDKGHGDATGEMSFQTLTYGSPAKLTPNSYQRTGYHFDGWKAGDNNYSDGEEVENLTAEHGTTITLTAQWAPNSYKAIFDTNQGTGTIDSLDVDYDGSCLLPSEGCTREGYRLVGWSTLPTPTAETTYELGATIPWNFDRDTTFYAVWQKEHTVRFDPANGDEAMEEKVLDGEFVTQPANPVRAYHSFGGWLLGNGSVYKFDLPVKQDMTLTAKWDRVYHTVTFDANGGSGSTNRTVMSGTTVAAPEVIYHGHRLIGWSTSQTGGALWDFNTEITADETLYAQWEAIPKYTLDFEVNEGSQITSVTDFEDTVIDLSDYQPTRDGYIFEGWYNDSGLTTQVTQITLTENQRVYAKWQEILDPDRYTLSFNSNGGSGIAQGTYDEGEVVQLGGFTPTREGYTFEGWYDNAGLTGSPISSVTMNQHQTVYAKWTAENYQVAIHLDGGAGDTTAHPVTYNESFTFPAADGYTKEGHHLIGWEIGTDRFEPGAVLEHWHYADNQTMTAIWAKNTYEIVFDSGVAPQYIQHGERVIEPTAPTREGFTFTGWYLTEDASGDPIDFESYTATEDTLLYAGWEATVEYYLVHFQSRDEHKVKTIQVRPGEKAPVPESWEWEGYTFEGWFTPAGDSIEAVEINEETTFEARWKAIEYTVTLRNPYGEEETIPYSRDDLKTFPIPERRGYTFGGWQEVSNTRATGEIHPDTSGMIGDYVLEAKWEAITYNVIFDTAGGENLSPIGFTVEDVVDSLPKATRDGYLFQGWYDADGKEVTSIAKETIGDQTLTARWLVDKTKLEALVADEAEKKRSADSYTANSWKVYEEALAHAQAILDKEDATPQEVTEALAGLQAAIKQLTEKGAVVQPDTPKPGDGGTGSGTTKQPSGGGTTNKITTSTTTVKRVNQSTGQSTQRKSLAQTGEKETALYLILGLAIVGFVIPAWKKNRDAMK